MSYRIEACIECTKKCLRHHGKKQTSSPSAAKFFKVMIGDQFLKVLYIPPKFATMVSVLVGQRTSLEDSNGKQWETKVSKLNGSFVFQQGWQSFALDHGLNVGDFLVFYYITGSHFVVDIYDKSGCQKLDFPVNGSKKKRARGSRNYVDQDGTHHGVDIDFTSKQSPVIPTDSGSDIEISQSQFENNVAGVKMATENNLNSKTVKRPQPVSEAHDMEDTNYIINRDIGDQQGEDRHILCDLSQFEMCGNKSGISESKKGIARDVYHTHTSAGLHIEAGLVNEDSVIEEVGTGAEALAVSKFELMGDKNDTSLIDKLTGGSDKDTCNKIAGHPSTNRSATKPIRDEDDCIDLSNKIQRTENSPSNYATPKSDKLVLYCKKRGSLTRNNPNSQVRFTGISKSGGSVTTGLSQCQSGELLNIDKKGPPDGTSERCGNWDTVLDICAGETAETIKKEPVEMTQSVHSWRDGEEMTKVMEGEHSPSSEIIIEDNDKVCRVVKSETVDLVCSPHHYSTDISCSVSSDNKTFLELPTFLPASSFNERRGIDRKVVVLKDPVMRLWPVLYLDRYGVKMLTSGWEAFSKANNIGGGDTCVFGIENLSKSIYRVSIIRK